MRLQLLRTIRKVVGRIVYRGIPYPTRGSAKDE